MITNLYFIVFTLLHKMLGSHQLEYALFTAQGPTGGFDSSGAVPAIELAEEMINADRSILSGYNLTHTGVYNTMCDRRTALNEYYDAISPWKPTIIGLLGCGCSEASEPVAEIIHYNSITQIAYASSSIVLSERQSFPNFFRTSPSDSDLPTTKVALLRQYGWRRVVFITQHENLLRKTFPMEGFTEANIEIKNRIGSSHELLEDLSNPLIDFFFEEKDFRVFFLNTDSRTTRYIMCEAYMRGFTYPRYAWVTNGWYQSSWWTEEVTPWSGECSDDELAEILHQSLVLEKYPEHNNSNAQTDVRLTPAVFYTLYEERITEPQTNISYYSHSSVATVAYDALWALALALNRTSEMVESLTREEIMNSTQCEGSDEKTSREWEIVSLENFTYTNQLMGCIVRWNLERTDFVGVSGHVMFDDTGSRVHSQVRISQYRLLDSGTLTLVDIADIERVNATLSEFVYENSWSNEVVYPRRIPPDGTPVTVVVTFHLSLVVICYVLATAGIIFSAVCLIFNFTQRKKKVVRLSSPNLNYIIILGSFVMNISIFFRVMPSADPSVIAARCYLDTLLNTIGYCLAYGALLAKMGRIHYIFHNPTANKKALKDWYLVLIAMAITVMGTALSVLQVSIPILQPIPYLVPNHEPPSIPMNELGLRVEEMVAFCYSPSLRPIASAWTGGTFVYLAILQLIGVILALRTRKVKIKALKDSTFIVSAIYISAVALIVIVISTFALGNLPNVIELLASGSLMVATTVGLSLVLVPKMVSLYKDPKGDHVMEQETLTDSPPTNISMLNTEDRSRVVSLESKVTALEKSLRECQLRLANHSLSPGLINGTSIESRTINTPQINVKSHYTVTWAPATKDTATNSSYEH